MIDTIESRQEAVAFFSPRWIVQTAGSRKNVWISRAGFLDIDEAVNFCRGGIGGGFLCDWRVIDATNGEIGWTKSGRPGAK